MDPVSAMNAIRDEYEKLSGERGFGTMMKRPKGLTDIAVTLNDMRMADRRNDAAERKGKAVVAAALIVRYLVDCTP